MYMLVYYIHQLRQLTFLETFCSSKVKSIVTGQLPHPETIQIQF